MDRRLAVPVTAVFIVSLGLGYGLGSMNSGGGGSDYSEDVGFTANASNPVERVTFDDRNISLIVQPGKNATFFLDVNGTVKTLKGLVHDGEVHEVRDFVTVDGKMYLVSMRYNDDVNKSGDEWISIYRIREL